jgi:hypothetical protein
LEKLTERAQRLISHRKSATAVLGVVTSCTFFGSAQAGVVLEWTAQQKYDRLLDQTTGRAVLMLAARIAQKAEADDVKQFLDSIYQVVPLNMRTPIALSPPKSVKNESAKDTLNIVRARLAEAHQVPELRSLVQRRVDELRSAMTDNAAVHKRSVQPGTFITSTKFKKALDTFIDSGAHLSTHPPSILFAAAGQPDQVPAIVKDLYTSEVSEFADQLLKKRFRAVR